MKIERIEAIALRMPLPRPLRAATALITHRATVLTRVHTDDGLTGECFSNNEMDGQAAILAIIRDELAPALRGHNPLLVERCWAAMQPATHDFLRDRRMAVRAIACVDAAIWDLVGRHSGQPLHRLLGGASDSVAAVTMGGYYRQIDDLRLLAEEVAAVAEDGYAGIKLKVGGLSPEQDALRVRTAREAAPDGFRLMADPNQGWTYPEAARFCRLVADYDLYWLEEPVHWHNDRVLLARLRAQTGVPLCAGQSEITKEGCRDLMAAGAIDVCNFDPSWGGGPTEWRKVAALAEAYGVDVVSHLEPQVGAALAASVPNGLHVEIMQPERDPLYHRLIANRPVVRDGRIALSERPGWGHELDPDVIAAYRVDSTD
jgi:D-galactarolactone cycloisomerase